MKFGKFARYLVATLAALIAVSILLETMQDLLQNIVKGEAANRLHHDPYMSEQGMLLSEVITNSLQLLLVAGVVSYHLWTELHWTKMRTIATVGFTFAALALTSYMTLSLP